MIARYTVNYELEVIRACSDDIRGTQVVIISSEAQSMPIYQEHCARMGWFEYLRVVQHCGPLQGSWYWWRMRLGIDSDYGCQIDLPTTIREDLVDLDDIPEPVRSHQRRQLADFTKFDFVDPVVQASRPPVDSEALSATGCCLRMRHTSGRYLLQSIFVVSDGLPVTNELQLVTFLSGPRTYATSSGRKTFDLIPSAQARYFPNRPLDTLIKHHTRVIERRESEIVHLGSAEKMLKHVEALYARWLISRTECGIYTPVASSPHNRDGNRSAS
jgi:hypothetical protein